MVNKAIFGVIIVFVLLSTFACSDNTKDTVGKVNETNLEFVTRYIRTVDNNITTAVYKDFWSEQANKYVLNERAKVTREIHNSVTMHQVVIDDKTLLSIPEVNEWNDPSQTVSFMFKLNKPTIVSFPGYPKSGDEAWTGYQITVEKENKRWVVSGESLVR